LTAKGENSSAPANQTPQAIAAKPQDNNEEPNDLPF